MSVSVVLTNGVQKIKKAGAAMRAVISKSH